MFFPKLLAVAAVFLSGAMTLADPIPVDSTTSLEARDNLMDCNECSGVLFGQENTNLITCGVVNMNGAVKRACFCAVYTPIKSHLNDHFGQQCQPSGGSNDVVIS